MRMESTTRNVKIVVRSQLTKRIQAEQQHVRQRLSVLFVVKNMVNLQLIHTLQLGLQMGQIIGMHVQFVDILSAHSQLEEKQQFTKSSWTAWMSS